MKKTRGVAETADRAIGRRFLLNIVKRFVLSVGIEPTLQAPQACVLSIERREPLPVATAEGVLNTLR